VLAITVFGKAVSDLLHGQFKQAWTDAKATVVGIVNQIKSAWKSLTTPQKVPGPEVGPPTIQGGTGGKFFDQHNEDQIKKAQNAAEEPSRRRSTAWESSSSTASTTSIFRRRRPTRTP
jgi:hypothetical protein